MSIEITAKGLAGDKKEEEIQMRETLTKGKQGNGKGAQEGKSG